MICWQRGQNEDQVCGAFWMTGPQHVFLFQFQIESPFSRLQVRGLTASVFNPYSNSCGKAFEPRGDIILPGQVRVQAWRHSCGLVQGQVLKGDLEESLTSWSGPFTSLPQSGAGMSVGRSWLSSLPASHCKVSTCSESLMHVHVIPSHSQDVFWGGKEFAKFSWHQEWNPSSGENREVSQVEWDALAGQAEVLGSSSASSNPGWGSGCQRAWS